MKDPHDHATLDLVDELKRARSRELAAARQRRYRERRRRARPEADGLADCPADTVEEGGHG